MDHRRDPTPYAAGALAAALALAGCTLRYDPDELSLAADAAEIDLDGPDGAVEEPDGGGEPDAFPGPEVSGIEPRAVFEGAGSVGEPVAVLIRGSGFEQDLEVESTSDALSVEAVAVAPEGTFAAIALRVHVDPDLDRGQFRDVELAVVQGEFAEDIALEIIGLDELELEGEYDVDPTTFDSLYSEITTAGDVSFRGDHPARLVATGSIAIDHPIDASGGHGESFAPGAGGCAGGQARDEGPGRDGACDGGGGGASGGGAGGGGAGHAQKGDPGVGGDDDRGDGGDPVPNAMVTPLGGEGGSRGSGGGGGDATLVGGSGGDGGGGGGVIELSSWGDLAIDAPIRVDGADGGTGTAGITGRGCGGGGAGGAILIRAGAALTAGGGSLSALGGAGGARDSCSDGGAGADGRIRIDAGSLGIPEGLEVSPSAARGPMWRDEPPAIWRNHKLTVEFVAEAGLTYAIEIDGETTDRGTPLGSTAEAAATFQEGLNMLCLVIPETFEQGLPESRNCRRVAYVPGD